MEESGLSIQEKEYISVNNNPFSYKGRIGRLTYFITGTVITFCIYSLIIIDSIRDKFDILSLFTILLMVFCAVLGFFAAIKRLRDMQWSKWFLLIILIPYIGTVLFNIPLLFVKSKYAN